jgi:dihydrofolate reductase
LVDALHLLINPVTLGAGTRLLQGGYDRAKWKMNGAQPFDSGAVLLKYERAA